MRTSYLIEQQIKKDFSKSKKRNLSVALIGLGPHAKRIYLNYFKKHRIDLSLLVDLESKREECRRYLLENGFKNTKVFTIDDKLKDNEYLPRQVHDNLLAVCKTMEITHIIIATEPKGHNMYLEFALKNNINVLTDKPITVVKNMTSLKSIKKIRKQYYDLLELANKSTADCNVMCQRQMHRGYEEVKRILNETVEKYKIPITYIGVFHCDGNWEMPHDLDKENHPYKYGYGKLFHSGYHFIDLVSELLKINNQLPRNKRISTGKVFGECFTPNDELAVFNIEDYYRFFNANDIPDFYKQGNKINFKKYGEKNFYGLMEFRNSNNQLITTVNMDLLHYGFSRRGWIKSKDFYKNNGRIRHESIIIEVGPLLCIQIHSYQAKEIKDRKDIQTEEQIGGLEHFDIDIYRNVDIIGGEPFQQIKLGDLYKDYDKENILGYNELSREVFIEQFLNDECNKSDIKDQALGIEILYSCAKSIYNHYKNIERNEKINVANKNVFPFRLETLKKYTNKKYTNYKKELKSSYEVFVDGFELGCYMNLLSTKEYQVYLIIENDNATVSPLLCKVFKSKLNAKIYYLYLQYLCCCKNINKIVKKIENR